MEKEENRSQYQVLRENSNSLDPHLRKVQDYDYCPWARVFDYGLKLCPEAKIIEHEFKNEAGVMQPFMQTKNGCFVKVSIEINNIVRSKVYPIRNRRKQFDFEPNPSCVEKALARCAVKVWALHGLGIDLWFKDFSDIDETNESTDNSVNKKTNVKNNEPVIIKPLPTTLKAPKSVGETVITFGGQKGKTLNEMNSSHKALSNFCFGYSGKTRWYKSNNKQQTTAMDLIDKYIINEGYSWNKDRKRDVNNNGKTESVLGWWSKAGE